MQDYRNEAGRTHDELDLALDAALEKFAAAEPRPGLEQRILANLRAEQVKEVGRAWWRWAVAGTLAAIVVAAFLGWIWEQSSRPRIANQPASGQSSSRPAPVVTKNYDSPTSTLRPKSTRARLHPDRHIATAPDNPKLDVFPSPRPLSEEERMLANYVANYPEQAALVAQARTEALRRDLLEREAIVSDSSSQH